MIIDKFIADNSLSHTVAYLDNITICGKSKEEHDKNFNKYIKTAKKFNLISNHNKCSFSDSTVDLTLFTNPSARAGYDTRSIFNLTGHKIFKGTIKTCLLKFRN